MSVIDKKGRLFGKINILDFVIIIVILTLVIASANKILNINTDTSLDTKSIKVKLLVREREEFSLENIKVGDIIKEYDTGFIFGEISDIEVVPATKEVKTVNGEVNRAVIPERYDMFIIVDANAVVTENAIVSGNKELRIGNQLVFRTRLYALKSIILEIKQD